MNSIRIVQCVDVCGVILGNGSRRTYIENKTMEQIALRKRGAGVLISALHAQNAALLGDWRCVIAGYLLYDNGHIELSI